MIFVTVGTDQPFDRMLRVINAWARVNNRRDLFAQVGVGAWKPDFIESVDFLEPREFKRRFNEAALIISHAGMGTIIAALQYSKPILIMPRKESMGETTNSHQMATAKKMSALTRVEVAFDDDELTSKLNRLEEFQPSKRIPSYANSELIFVVNNFIHDRFFE